MTIENQRHGCPDVSFGDDTARVRNDHRPPNLATIKRPTPGLAKQTLHPDRLHPPRKAQRTSLKVRRPVCGGNEDILIQTLTREDRL